MKHTIIFLFCFIISSCVLIPLYSIPDDDAKWVNRMTGENVPIAVLEKCEKYALFSVIGRSGYSDRVDDEYLSNLEKIRQIKGGCLYERGFVFKVKLFSVYCSKLEEVCKAYSKYRN